MKRFLASILIASSALSLTPPAKAQWVVYDPANHISSILQLIEAVEGVINQIVQLANEVKMLESMAKDLESLPQSIAQDILDRLARIEDLTQQANGIGYQIKEIERQYEDLYPEDQATQPPGHDELLSQARARWIQSRSALEESLKLAAQVVQNTRADTSSLNSLIARSQSAAGNLQAVQAGNQIEGLQTQQLIQMQNLMAGHYRAQVLENSRALAEAERGRARTKAFLEGDD